ncbi:hypothetical protein I4U23_004509 [Adineta vaga]|nr:hypothetical protein I4U23_004509 [Adineta vaga]
MNEITKRAEDAIYQLINENSPEARYRGDTELKAVYAAFRALRETSTHHEWTPLVLQQLARMMDCNESLDRQFWLEIHQDIRYLLDKLHTEQNHRYWARFQARMKLEEKIQERRRQFEEMYGERKTLYELCVEHRHFLLGYLQKCISIHSKIEICNLIENIDELKSLKIDFDCSSTSLESIDPSNSSFTQSSDTTGNNPRAFLPSLEKYTLSGNKRKKTIRDLLQSKRWLVILGGPGYAKTTLLRWIMHISARAALQHIAMNSFEKDLSCLFRLPIFIRIDAFVEWFEQHQNSTLFDYLTKHISSSEVDQDENALKEFIIHGYALILLDGLDQIVDVERKGVIVDQIRNFLDKYTCTWHFLSPFDKALYKDKDMYGYSPTIYETQLLNLAAGNQVIITSRVVGYHIHSLNGPFIVHYSLLPLTDDEADRFVQNWMEQVERSISTILTTMNKDIFQIKRDNVLKVIFDKNTKFTMLNPDLLTFICMSMITLSDEFDPNCRLQVYHRAIQLIIRMWNKQNSTISEHIFIEFLTDLAVYLQTESPSGLIDEFDVEHLCYLTYKRYHKSVNRTELRRFTDELTSALGSNIGITAERGWQVFGFLHLSYQEYFVARAFVERSSTRDLAERLHGFVIYPRFREPLLLALSWISWQRSKEQFDEFCRIFLEKQSADFIIPLGTLVFLEALTDMCKLPSNDIIFTALNILLDHQSYHMFANHCFTTLSILSDEIKLEWIELHLTDEQRFYRFCRYLLAEEVIDRFTYLSKVLSPVVSKQLWLISCKYQTREFLFYQTLSRIITRNKPFDNIIRNTLSTFLISKNMNLTDIHPLIFSVIIILYGGLVRDDKYNRHMIQFSPYQMYRQSLTLFPIIEYFVNKKESHLIKVQRLIEQYISFLRRSSSEDTSVDIIDTFVALICLRGLTQPLDYQEFDGYQALPLAMKKFKQNLFYTKKKELFDISEVQTILNVFASQSNVSNEQIMLFSLACGATLKKLNIKLSADILDSEIIRYYKLECQSEFNFVNPFDNTRNIKQISEGNHHLQIMQDTSYFLLAFVPQSLQPLYHHLIQTNSLSLVVLLSQCLVLLENNEIDSTDRLISLSILESSYREFGLGTYASILFWRERRFLKKYQYSLEECDQFINEVKQRTGDQNDIQRFATSISLAVIYRIQYQLIKGNNEEIYSILMTITDPILRVLAASIILNMKNPCVFDEQQRDELKNEMIHTLKICLPNLSLLTSTLLFVHCYPFNQRFVDEFQEINKEIIIKLHDTSNDKSSQEAAYIALRSLKHFSDPLTKFEKQTTNLSDLLQFNSTIFHHYFTDQISFDQSNPVLLSCMYLAELTVDVDILKMFCKEKIKETGWLISEFDELFIQNILTFEIATWITNYLKFSDRKHSQYIIDKIIQSDQIEKKAHLIMKQWIVYRTDADLQVFAYYAAALDIENDENTSLLIDTINNESKIKYGNTIKVIIKTLLESDMIVSQTNLTKIIECASRAKLQTSACVHSIEIFKIILNHSLHIINDCSLNVQNYLAEYFNLFLESNHISNPTEDIHLARILQWLIVLVTYQYTKETFSKSLYECIFQFLDDQRYPQVQRTIIYAFRGIFSCSQCDKNHIFMSEHVLMILEKMICSSSITMDILNACLLAYGNRLLRCKELKINHKVSDEMCNVFERLSNTTLSDCISARALLCLIYSKRPVVIFSTITNWLTTLPNITPKKRYDVFLQEFLYSNKDIFLDNVVKELVRLIQTYSNELLDTFIMDLYKFISGIAKKTDLLNPKPDYVRIAGKFISVNSSLFCDCVKNQIGEEKFKKRLYEAHQQEACAIFITLYVSFGLITNELIDMLAQLGSGLIYLNDSVFENIQKISDRDVIENIFDHLKSSFDPQGALYSFLFKLAFQLARENIISAFEMHQCAAFLMNNNTEKFGGALSIGGDVRDTFGSLVSLSCLEKDSIWPCGVKFFSENDIDESVRQDIQYSKNKSLLYLRRNYFLENLAFTS